MSSRPSAFDALMSGARADAAAKIKSPQSSSSPKKRIMSGARANAAAKQKSPQSSSSPKKLIMCGSLAEAAAKQKSPQSSSSPNKRKTIDSSTPPKIYSYEDVPAAKKRCAVTDQEKTSKLRSNILELKKKGNDFNPKSVACWEWNKGERVPFLFLSLAFDLISEESSEIVITDIVCNTLRTLMYTTSDDLLAAVYLLATKIAPSHEGLELGFGDALLIKVIAETFEKTEVHVQKQYEKLGDLGLVAQASTSKRSRCTNKQSYMMRKTDALTVVGVFDRFRIIAKESGKGSQKNKKNHIKLLLVAATECEPLYLIRLLQRKLRIRLGEETVLAALGQAAVYAEKHSTPPLQSSLEEAAKIVKQVYSVLPVYEKIVPALLTGGVWNLPTACTLTPGIPVGPMLAKPIKAVSEILNKFQNTKFTCEYKYDGERAQIHYMENGSVEIYSRNAERSTGKFPDVVIAASRLKKPTVTSFILDCELVAYDREKQKILTLQVLSTRARKNVVVSKIKVQVCIFAFDLLYLNGQALIQEQLKLRREHLYNSFVEEPGYFQFAKEIRTNDLEEITKFLDTSVAQSCEGLVIKTLDRDATYEPSKPSLNWLKLKKAYMNDIGDSLDLVPIGAFHGLGKRTGVYGTFLLACYDKVNKEFQSISKIGTGFSDALLEELSASLCSKVIQRPEPSFRYGAINPDVWFEPTEVWEVKAESFTISSVYRAGVGILDTNKVPILDNDKGISLRCPCLVRIREDKAPKEASSSEQVAEMYIAQNDKYQTIKMT